MFSWIYGVTPSIGRALSGVSAAHDRHDAAREKREAERLEAKLAGMSAEGRRTFLRNLQIAAENKRIAAENERKRERSHSRGILLGIAIIVGAIIGLPVFAALFPTVAFITALAAITSLVLYERRRRARKGKLGLNVPLWVFTAWLFGWAFLAFLASRSQS